ncbi:MAG TPA: energy transducer TonB [Bryobacteraceae bacterium]|jgi:protein TonB|nr:energy transducer TonB [Bryobacteraceae bacterium]
MFEQTFVEGNGKTNKSWTVLVSFAGQIVLITVAVILPLIYTEVLPATSLQSFLVAPPPPPPPPPPPAAAPPVKVVKVIPRQFDAGKLMAPKVVPKEIAVIKEDEMPPPSSGVGVVGGVSGGVAGGTFGGVLGGIIGSVPSAAPPPPPPPPPVAKKVETPQRIRVGGNVQSAMIIRKTSPVYPQLAKSARVQGVVHLAAVIAKDGTIQELHSLGGPALLIQAAMDAVKTWVYRPTMLNGEPVQVETTIDVNFTLNQ